jgi:hypothetical protein
MDGNSSSLIHLVINPKPDKRAALLRVKREVKVDDPARYGINDPFGEKVLIEAMQPISALVALRKWIIGGAAFLTIKVWQINAVGINPERRLPEKPKETHTHFLDQPKARSLAASGR